MVCAWGAEAAPAEELVWRSTSKGRAVPRWAGLDWATRTDPVGCVWSIRGSTCSSWSPNSPEAVKWLWPGPTEGLGTRMVTWMWRLVLSLPCLLKELVGKGGGGGGGGDVCVQDNLKTWRVSSRRSWEVPPEVP